MAWMQQRNEKFFTLFSKLWLERRQERRNRVAVAMSMSAVGAVRLAWESSQSLLRWSNHPCNIVCR